MKKTVTRIICIIMIATLFCGTFSMAPVSAETASEIQDEIDRLEDEAAKLQSQINSLKNKADEQQKLKKAIEDKMAVVQQQINACNKQINAINQKISANKAEIAKKEAKIEQDKLSFKKRLRAIYMSNTGSNVQVLLGAESFSDFLQLSQLTASVSAHDKKIIENIVAEIEDLQKKQEENNKLLQEQSQLKATITEKQNELKSQAASIESVISSINSDKSSLESDKASVEDEIESMERYLNSIMSGGSGSNITNDGQFLWPTTFRQISSPFGSRWGKMHNGIDIANGTWGKPVFAMTDGQVYKCVNSCTHNYRKVTSSGSVYSCGCGGGYGNYVAIDHGKYNGKSYKAYYAHMSSVVVSNGEYVKKGQIIGYIGCTGRSTGPHLHFGIMENDIWVNPEKFF